MNKLFALLTSMALIISSLVLAPSSSAVNDPEVIWATGATATSQYDSDYAAELATGAPDAAGCGDIGGQAWTYGEPWADSQLELTFDEPILAEQLLLYFSNDLENSIQIEIAGENGEYWPLTSINTINDNGKYCGIDNDAEYVNNIKYGFPLTGTVVVSKVRLTVQMDSGYPEIDAVGIVPVSLVKPNYTKAPVVSGKAKVGKYLTINDFSAWTGNPRITFNYTWFSCTKAGSVPTKKKPKDCKAIGEPQDIGILTLVKAQKGKYIRVRVIGENYAGSKTVFTKTSKKVS